MEVLIRVVRMLEAISDGSARFRIFLYSILPFSSPSSRMSVFHMDSYLRPVHFFSHGSTAMLGEESASADYWQECGNRALENGVKHVIIMVEVPTGINPLHELNLLVFRVLTGPQPVMKSRSRRTQRPTRPPSAGCTLPSM